MIGADCGPVHPSFLWVRRPIHRYSSAKWEGIGAIHTPIKKGISFENR